MARKPPLKNEHKDWSQAIRCRAPGIGKQSHLGETFYKSSMQNSHREAQAKDELKKKLGDT